MPPLRERAGDIPILVRHFLAKIARREGRPEASVSPETLDLMMDSARATYAQFTQARAANPTEATTQLTNAFGGMLNKLRFLTEDVTILPGRKAKFYTCFEYVPGAADDQEINEKFFKTRKEITVGFYDVPVQRDAAGNVKKKTSYQFAFKVVKQ